MRRKRRAKRRARLGSTRRLRQGPAVSTGYRRCARTAPPKAQASPRRHRTGKTATANIARSATEHAFGGRSLRFKHVDYFIATGMGCDYPPLEVFLYRIANTIKGTRKALKTAACLDQTLSEPIEGSETQLFRPLITRFLNAAPCSYREWWTSGFKDARQVVGEKLKLIALQRPS